MYTVWFYASAMVRLGSGPVWNFGMRTEALYCQENWWTNALFINNYVFAETMVSSSYT